MPTLVYGLAADVVLMLHLVFIVFVAFGAALAFRWRWIPIIQGPAAAWGAAAELFDMRCPLTPLEQHLRAMAGEGAYSGSFIEHWLVPLIYPGGLSPVLRIGLGIFVIALNVVLYACLWWRSRRHGG